MSSSPNVPLPSQLAKYADLFERMLDPVLLLDPTSYVILEANDACERILGGEVEKLRGRSLLQLIDEPWRDDFAKALRVATRRYYPRLFESLWHIPDWLASGDKTLTMETLACPLKLSDKVEVLQVIARDITFRRETEHKMQHLLTELQAANEKLNVLSTTDEMTGLFNFRYFKSQLMAEHARADRYATPYGIVFCDIDHFKHYNDHNGHPAGDALLRQLAGILKAAARNTDLPARYGGEEFVVLCAGVDWEGALVMADRLQKAVAKAKFPHGEAQPGGKLSLSIGVAGFPIDGTTMEEILEAADQAMYYSKTHGRDKITTSHFLRGVRKRAA